MYSNFRESDMILALHTLRTTPHLTPSHVAWVYNVPRKTLTNRYHGKLSRQDTRPKSQKLTPLEESVIVRYILDLDSQAFPPRRSCVEDIANRILSDRNSKRVGKNWTTNFVQR